jgi:hypothetical protein
MEFKISNLNVPSNKKFKKIADVLLYTLPLYSGAILLLEASAPKFALICNFIVTLTVITLKGLTKFTAEEPVIEEEPIEETPVVEVEAIKKAK